MCPKTALPSDFTRLSLEDPSDGEEGYGSTGPYSFELQQAVKSS